MKHPLIAAALLFACVLPATAITPGDQPAQSYCRLLAQADFSQLPWDDRIGGCAGRKSWPGENGFEVAHYVYRVGGSKNTLEGVTLLAKPGQAHAKAGRAALAAAATEAANLLSGEGPAIAKAVLAGKDAKFKAPGWLVEVNAKDPAMLKVKFWSQKFLDADCAEVRKTHPQAKC